MFRREWRQFLLAVGCILAATTAHVPAANAQAPTVPSQQIQEILIKTTLLTFNDANVTGNYSVLHARTSKAFQEAVSEEKLKTAFKPFADSKLELWSVAISPIVSQKAAVDSRGILVLEGLVKTPGSSSVKYELKYTLQDGDWEIFNIDVGTVQN